MLLTVEKMKKKGNFTKADLALLGLGGDDEMNSKRSGMSPN
jgi:hypothetical protein